MENIVGAGGIRLRQHNGIYQVLLVKEREDNPSLKKKAGMLSIPMGHVMLHEKETYKQAAEREFLEETGVSANAVWPFGIFYLKNIPIWLYFVAAANDDNPSSSCGELETLWVDAPAILKMSDEIVRPPTKEAVRVFLYRLGLLPQSLSIP